jgi:acetylornithine/succinyldiaminopimelate/putrescine aminotransferase
MNDGHNGRQTEGIDTTCIVCNPPEQDELARREQRLTEAEEVVRLVHDEVKCGDHRASGRNGIHINTIAANLAPHGYDDDDVIDAVWSLRQAGFVFLCEPQRVRLAPPAAVRDIEVAHMVKESADALHALHSKLSTQTKDREDQIR